MPPSISLKSAARRYKSLLIPR